MREYQRTSRQLDFQSFPPEMISAFRKYFEKHELGSIEADIVACCETVNTRTKQGFLSRVFRGGDYVRTLAVFFTPGELFWCQTDAKDRPVVLSAKFADVEISDFKSDLVEDHGIEVFGLIGQFSERVRAFLGFGEEPAARDFISRLKKAAAKL